jgi:hypothetical protein
MSAAQQECRLLIDGVGRPRCRRHAAGVAKYDPLCGYLRRQRASEFELTFAEIERVIGALLPHSAQRPQWWANVADPQTTHVQRRAWGEAGYDAFLVLGKDRVRFKRAAPP